jgi:hypothetical protein
VARQERIVGVVKAQLLENHEARTNDPRESNADEKGRMQEQEPLLLGHCRQKSVKDVGLEGWGSGSRQASR